ncbi:MAG: tRNA (guanosine(46)-N7)-methyltransferase TrmB [Lachnospiraceae bacterium]|jgi:tRNA (guanine-N7-)-methyltransferase|nr:tRNA (guanosine(46)-N7)-methyltransferase TrmB [Lachnospiraceae bacterium]
MRLRNVTGSEQIIAKSNYVCCQPEQLRGKWYSFFQNENPIHIEIGMGKGKFITKMAKLNPSINYIGIEKYSSVLYRAVQKIDKDEQSSVVAVKDDNDGHKRREYPNLVFICMDAREITAVFDEGEVKRIYLNFSDPWPKDRHAKRRLPSREFIGLYDKILSADGRLEFKTDNEGLFRFAMDEVTPAGWQTDQVTWDLHHDPIMVEANVMTEYEEKFAAKGNPIYKYIISR